MEPVRPGTELAVTFRDEQRYELFCFTTDCCHPSRCLMNDDCSGATSECVVMCARSACASLPVGVSTVKIRDSNGVSRVPVVFSPTTGSRVHTETRQASSSATNENSTQWCRSKLQHCRSKLSNVAAPLPRLNVRCGDGDETECGFWHSYGLVRCQGVMVKHQRACATTVSTHTKNQQINAKYCYDDFPNRGPAPRQRQTVKTCSLCLLAMMKTASERSQSKCVPTGFILWRAQALASPAKRGIVCPRFSLSHHRFLSRLLPFSLPISLLTFSPFLFVPFFLGGGGEGWKRNEMISTV